MRPMPKNSHILNAASNLLGIAMLIVTGLKITNRSIGTYADECALVAALLLAFSCLFSYLSIRGGDMADRMEDWADHIFLVGLICLCAAVVVLVL